MHIHNLHIEFEFGKIGINTYKGYLASKMNIQENFTMDVKTPKTLVASTFPAIEDIDTSHCRADMGYPQPLAAASKWYNEAKLYVLKYIGHKAAGGDSLGAVERGISIGDIVEGESFSSQPEVNIEAVPKSPPKITFRHGRVKHSLSKGNVNVKMDITKKPVTMEYDSARVNIFMEKNPYLNIKVAQKSKKIDSTV